MDVRVLESEGMDRIWVTELEDGEVSEDDAVCSVASEMGCGSFEIRLAAGGRANLLATEKCCLLVDDELLKQINCTASVVIATTLNFSFAVPGQRIATVKSAPFASFCNTLTPTRPRLRPMIAVRSSRADHRSSLPQ